MEDPPAATAHWLLAPAAQKKARRHMHHYPNKGPLLPQRLLSHTTQNTQGPPRFSKDLPVASGPLCAQEPR